MSNMDLFVTTAALTFQKTASTEKAASAHLDEDPTAWPRQILTELFRTTPETSDYTPRVEMMKIDEESGFGMGVVIIENTTDSSLAVARPGPTSRRVLIPVIVKNHVLCPLDLIMMRNGRMLPLKGQTLREALFRPETFEMTTEDWGDTSIYNQFHPPGRGSAGFGSGIGGGGSGDGMTTITGPGMKFSSDAAYTMLNAILPTILGQDIDVVGKTAAEVIRSAASDSAFVGALRVLAGADKTVMRDAGIKDLMKLATASVAADVVQIGFSEESGYWRKQASRKTYSDPSITLMSRAEAIKFAGTDVVAKVDTDGAVTVAPTAVQVTEIDLSSSTWSVIDKPGIYKVKTVHGKEQVGWVIPNLLDLDGTFVPMAVFTNGASAMVQGQIVGSHVAAGVDLPSAPAKGTGVFYAAGQGGVQATVPVMVLGSESNDSGESFLVRSLTGEESRVRLVPGLSKIVVLKNEFHMPSSARFLSLNEETMVPLIDTEEQVSKTASGTRSITVFGGDYDDVVLRFHGMPKLAAVTAPRLGVQEAAFVLCLAGTPAKLAYEKIARAQAGETVMVSGLEDVRLASDVVEQTRKLASSRSHEVRALRQSLVKEAAVLPDAMTVDAVLSLGFINSENVRMYISSIPYLEKCLSKVCELVLGSRLGLTEIPEFAAARAARALDEVIQGLKALALRDVREDGRGM